MRYPSDHAIQTLGQKLTQLMGESPKESWTVNLALELELLQAPLSDLELIKRYQAIRDLHLALK